MMIEEVTGGLINYCLRVSSKDGKSSIVLKHAKDTAKVLFIFLETEICDPNYQSRHKAQMFMLCL